MLTEAQGVLRSWKKRETSRSIYYNSHSREIYGNVTVFFVIANNTVYMYIYIKNEGIRTSISTVLPSCGASARGMFFWRAESASFSSVFAVRRSSEGETMSSFFNISGLKSALAAVVSCLHRSTKYTFWPGWHLRTCRRVFELWLPR